MRKVHLALTLGRLGELILSGRERRRRRRRTADLGAAPGRAGASARAHQRPWSRAAPPAPPQIRSKVGTREIRELRTRVRPRDSDLRPAQVRVRQRRARP